MSLLRWYRRIRGLRLKGECLKNEYGRMLGSGLLFASSLLISNKQPP